MARYECSVCGYVYDEAEQGRPWRDLPDDWKCPACGAPSSAFPRKVEGEPSAAGALRGSLVAAHRAFGYAFLAIYLFFLWQMVPRLWTYQIEFPARSAIHIALGMALGAVLLLKIVVVRFFPRLDATLATHLGATLLVGSVVLIGLSAPHALHEAVIEHTVAEGGIFADENVARVRAQLAQTGLDDAQSSLLASAESLRAGRGVLRGQCVACHDLRTVLARPRTPENWRSTVRRMADRTTLFDPLGEREQWQVTAYLIAISPRLQQSTQSARAQQNERRRAAEAVAVAEVESSAYDAGRARALFEAKCAGCHPLQLVERHELRSEDDARDLVARMVEEGLSGTDSELAQIVRYLTATYVKPSQ